MKRYQNLGVLALGAALLLSLTPLPNPEPTTGIVRIPLPPAQESMVPAKAKSSPGARPAPVRRAKPQASVIHVPVKVIVAPQ